LSSSSILAAPIPPVIPEGGGATIFVSVPHFRDGWRCGRTLKRLFETASCLDKVTVGLIEQTNPSCPDNDPTCLREYCALVGGGGRDRAGAEGGEGGEASTVIRDCPRAVAQILSVRFSHLHAKGPVYARLFLRKVLGNEGQLRPSVCVRSPSRARGGASS
jgi:hypothetical protein